MMVTIMTSRLFPGSRGWYNLVPGLPSTSVLKSERTFQHYLVLTQMFSGLKSTSPPHPGSGGGTQGLWHAVGKHASPLSYIPSLLTARGQQHSSHGLSGVHPQHRPYLLPLRPPYPARTSAELPFPAAETHLQNHSVQESSFPLVYRSGEYFS